MDRSDVSAWLAVNKLSYIEQTFLERNISIEELADFNSEELKDFAKDLKLDALATRRFIKAIEDQKVLGGGSKKKQNPPKQIQKVYSEMSVVEEAAPAFDYNIPEGLVEEGEKEGVEGGNVGLGEEADDDLVKPGDDDLIKPEEKEQEKPASMKISGRIQGSDDKVHIIVTPVEQESLGKLQERLDLCDALIDSIESCFNGLNNQSEKTKQEISKKMDSVLDSLKEKEQTVRQDAQKMEQQKEAALKSQLKYLMDHQNAINASKRKYQELVADADKDVHERRLEIVTMCNNVINDKNVSLSIATSPDVKFGFQMDTLRQFCNRLVINDCDEPAPPMGLTALKVSSDSALLEWKMLELAENKPILELSIEAALLPESELIREKVDENTKEKKKEPKKKGKKKQKKGSDDGSDESESESEKSSEESEESEEESEEESGSSSDKDSKSRKKRKKAQKKKTSKKDSKKDSKKTVNKMQSLLQMSIDPNVDMPYYSEELDLFGQGMPPPPPPPSSKSSKKRKDDDSDREDGDKLAETGRRKKEEKGEDAEGETVGAVGVKRDPKSYDANNDNQNKNAPEINPEQLLNRYPDLQWKEWQNIDLAGRSAKKWWKKLKSTYVRDGKESDNEKDEKKKKKKQKNKKDKESGKNDDKNKYWFLLPRLKEERVYLIRMRAKNESGWSQYSQTIRIQTTKLTIDSKIVKSEEEKNTLIGWLPKKYRGRRWKLLFRASKYTFQSYKFHEKCDNKKNPTIVIVESTNKHVFGGFVTIGWSQNGNYCYDPQAFIFKLREPNMHKKSWQRQYKQMQKSYGKNAWSVPGKFNCTQPGNAINCTSGYGPTFGGGHDFYVCNMSNTQSGCYAYAGHSYSCARSDTFLSGIYNFMTKEYEVFELKK